MRKSDSGKKTLWGIGIMFGLLISLIITACAHTKGEFVKLGTEIYPPKSEAQEVLLTQSDIKRPYREIGLVKVKGDPFSNEKECLEKIREIAKEAGADAVIKAHVEEKERLIFRGDPEVKFRKMETYRVKEPVCEGTAVVFAENETK
jgi:hypothetical protein